MQEREGRRWRQRAALRATRFPASLGVVLGGATWLPLGLTEVLGLGSLVYFVTGGILLTVLANGLWRYRRLREARPAPGLPPMKAPVKTAVPAEMGERDE